MKKLLCAGFAALMIMSFSLKASAATMSVNYGDLKHVNFNYPGKTGGYIAEFEIELSDGVSLEDFSFRAYCVDLDHTIGKGDHDIDSLTPITADSGKYLSAAWLMDKYASDTSTLNQVAGLQLAIWEVVYDTYNTTTKFTYTASGNAEDGTVDSYYTNYYNSYLTALSNGVDLWSSLGYQYATVLSNNSGVKNQDILVQMNPVPEPGTMLLLGMGLVGLGAAGKKRGRKK